MDACHRAVPRHGLLHHEPSGRPALDRPSWSHLLSYLDQVDALPDDLSPLTPDTRAAMAALRDALQAFGPLREVRAAPEPYPGVQPPPGLCAGVLWVVHRLRAGAAQTAAAIQVLQRSGSDAPTGGWREKLLQLGSISHGSRGGMLAVARAVRAAQPAIARANEQLVHAFVTDADHLQRLQERRAELRAQVEQAQQAARKKGLLAALSRRALTETQLRALQDDLARASAQAEALQRAVDAVCAVIDESGWVDPALDAVAEFVEQAHLAWTQVGAGVARVAADASLGQLENPAWRESALGVSEAAAQWLAISRAAQAFSDAVPAGWAARVLQEERLS